GPRAHGRAGREPRHRREDRRAARGMSGAPRYSVVVTAHNAVGSIAACLASVAGQEGVAEGEVEIVLVDDRSTDGTAEAALSAGVPVLRLLRVDHPPQ